MCPLTNAARRTMEVLPRPGCPLRITLPRGEWKMRMHLRSMAQQSQFSGEVGGHRGRKGFIAGGVTGRDGEGGEREKK